ncbi:TIGR04283 family arsenosugar biosynthesis glycosyltransferase [Seonamhaeicola maritimus]|uniref:Glycosyltransferase n=1 Tax=Seonamhaeicola maritimus TaxID=2591822 RepID=A0A5C7GGH9_9FLAO|nr:TIGR04283 family arsenosugar biosynthesis glycosyltransferase [Seonamhaeicola maritimus]TXG36612.1 glycosyltransferase [Seonamhaeicola maritimus]
MNNISIIIPTLNEAAHIKQLLIHLLNNSSKKNISEIIIVDGGSNDSTKKIIESFTITRKQLLPTINQQTAKEDIVIQLIHSEKGRAKQMNLGAKNATGNILYFLHADSIPPKHFDQLIIGEVEKGNEAGCFRMKFNSNHWWLKIAGWLTKFPWRIARGGDQSQFVTKSLFNDIGCYNEKYIIYEDNDLISKLYKQKQFVVIQEWLITSPRCYSAHGVWKLQFHYWNIHLRKWLGAEAQTLNNYYLKHVLVKKS